MTEIRDCLTGKPKVFIGAPVRDRGWILQRHLNALKEQTGIEPVFHYILNDSDDDSEDILKANSIHFTRYDLGKEHGSVRGKYSMKNLSRLRNKLLKKFLESGCGYFFSVDTDVIVPPNSILKLLRNNKDITSMLIRNHPSIMAHNALNHSGHLHVIPYNELIEVEITGAVYLIKRDVIEAGVKYSYNPNGEDIPFCDSARNKGFKLYCDTSIKPIHAYCPELDLIAKTTKTIGGPSNDVCG